MNDDHYIKINRDAYADCLASTGRPHPYAAQYEAMLAARGVAPRPVAPPAHGPGPLARARAARPGPVVTKRAPVRPAAPAAVVDRRTPLERLEALERAVGIVPPRQSPVAASAMARAMGLESVSLGVVDLGDRLVLGVDVAGEHARPRATSSGRGLSAEQVAAMDRAAGAPEVPVGGFGSTTTGTRSALSDYMDRCAGQAPVADEAFGRRVPRATSAPLSRELVARIAGAL